MTLTNWTRQRYHSSQTGRHHCRIVSLDSGTSTSAIHAVDLSDPERPVVTTVSSSRYTLVRPAWPGLPNSDLTPGGDWHLAPMRGES